MIVHAMPEYVAPITIGCLDAGQSPRQHVARVGRQTSARFLIGTRGVAGAFASVNGGCLPAPNRRVPNFVDVSGGIHHSPCGDRLRDVVTVPDHHDARSSAPHLK